MGNIPCHSSDSQATICDSQRNFRRHYQGLPGQPGRLWVLRRGAKVKVKEKAKAKIEIFFNACEYFYIMYVMYVGACYLFAVLPSSDVHYYQIIIIAYYKRKEK